MIAMNRFVTAPDRLRQLARIFFADRCLLLFVRNRFRDGPALRLESDPEAIGEHGPPLSIWKAPRDVAATIVIVTREHQAEGLALGMSFHATYFQAAAGTHYWNYEDCRTLGLQL
jgi:hypothetical protein